MKTSLVTSLIVACVLTLSVVSQLGAQNGRPSAPGTNIALIDIGFIFKNHIRFKKAMDTLGADIRVTEDTLNKERATIGKLMEKLKDFKAGTTDYKRLEEDIAQKQADFTVKAQIQKREFQEREASLYYKTIQEINDAVKYFADSQGIGLVMKFNGDPVDPNDRESVMRELNKPVMYHNGINITNIILENLNRGEVAFPGKGPHGAAPGAGPAGLVKPQGGGTNPSAVRPSLPPR